MVFSLFLGLILYYFFYYKRRTFYERKRRDILHEKKKFELMCKAYGKIYTLSYYFNQDKIFLFYRNFFIFEEFGEVILEKLTIEVNQYLSNKKIPIKIKFSLYHSLYNEQYIFNFIDFIRVENGQKLNLSQLKIISTGEVYEMCLRAMEELEEVYLSQRLETIYKLMVLKKVYEEAYYTKNLDLSAIRTKHQIEFFYTEELYFFNEYRKDLALHKRMLKALEESQNL